MRTNIVTENVVEVAVSKGVIALMRVLLPKTLSRYVRALVVLLSMLSSSNVRAQIASQDEVICKPGTEIVAW